MKTFVLLGFGFVLAVAAAETNSIVTTNWVKTWHKFRVVRGQLYDSERSYKWENIKDIEYVQPLTNAAAFQRVKKIRLPSPDNRRSLDARSGIPGRTISPTPGPTKKEMGAYIIVTNYPDLHATGTVPPDFRAMVVGLTTYQGQQVTLYDYGTDHLVPVVVTNKVRQGLK